VKNIDINRTTITEELNLDPPHYISTGLHNGNMARDTGNGDFNTGPGPRDTGNTEHDQYQGYQNQYLSQYPQSYPHPYPQQPGPLPGPGYVSGRHSGPPGYGYPPGPGYRSGPPGPGYPPGSAPGPGYQPGSSHSQVLYHSNGYQPLQQQQQQQQQQYTRNESNPYIQTTNIDPNQYMHSTNTVRFDLNNQDDDKNVDGHYGVPGNLPSYVYSDKNDRGLKNSFFNMLWMFLYVHIDKIYANLYNFIRIIFIHVKV
jgi:hypothetical protein